jgi:hypothetical protein
MRNSFAIVNHHEMNESVRKFIADIIIYFIDKKLKNKKPIIARRE